MILHRKLLIGVSKFMTFKWDNSSRHSADLPGRPMHHPDIIASPVSCMHCFDFLGSSTGLLSIAEIPQPSLICGKSGGVMTEIGILVVSMAF